MAIVEVEKFSNYSDHSDMDDLHDAVIVAIEELQTLLKEVATLDTMITDNVIYFDQSDCGGDEGDWINIVEDLNDHLNNLETLD